MARFLEPDPYDKSAQVTNPQSWNRYTYVENSPIQATDPDGMLLQLWVSAPLMNQCPTPGVVQGPNKLPSNIPIGSVAAKKIEAAINAKLPPGNKASIGSNGVVNIVKTSAIGPATPQQEAYLSKLMTYASPQSPTINMFVSQGSSRTWADSWDRCELDVVDYGKFGNNDEPSAGTLFLGFTVEMDEKQHTANATHLRAHSDASRVMADVSGWLRGPVPYRSSNLFQKGGGWTANLWRTSPWGAGGRSMLVFIMWKNGNVDYVSRAK